MAFAPLVVSAEESFAAEAAGARLEVVLDKVTVRLDAGMPVAHGEGGSKGGFRAVGRNRARPGSDSGKGRRGALWRRAGGQANFRPDRRLRISSKRFLATVLSNPSTSVSTHAASFRALCG